MKIGSVNLRPLQVGIIISTLLTALIHLSLGQPQFILNGLGYLALLAAYFLPIPLAKRWHNPIRWLFAAYIILTIILYFVFHPNGTWRTDGLGMATKLIEVILLLLINLDNEGSPVEETDSL